MDAAPNNATTLVIYGHTTDKDAASVQFDDPNGQTITAPVSPSGFFIVGKNVSGSMCNGWGAWSPQFAVLGNNGQQLSTKTVSLLAAPRTWTIPGRGKACGQMGKGPFGSSAGQLPLGG